MIRYRHPKHGYHIIGYGDDVAALEAAGWVPDVPELEPVPEPPAPTTERAPAPEPAPAAEPEPPVKRGPGRPRKAW